MTASATTGTRAVVLRVVWLAIALGIALLWPMTAPVVLPRAINEILFPMGCALALWAARALVVHDERSST